MTFKTYTIYVCPEHGVEGDPLVSHESPTGFRCRRLWYPPIPAGPGRESLPDARNRVVPLEKVEVIPRPDNRWLVVAEEELRPIVEQAGVDEVAQAGAALNALAKYREATDE